jgi:hypothetical protein
MARRAPQEIFARRISGQPGIAEKLLDLVGTIPTPRETRAADPGARARALARKAAAKSATTAGALALPPGPLGWLTIAPELYAVWRIQAQMVADIAGAYGKRNLLTREQMLYCLFGHTAAGAFRDLVIRVGERYVIRRAPLSALYAIANKIGIRIAQRSAGRVVTRWVPALGALGVAGYVFYDTGKVADASIDLFSRDVKIEGELEVEGVEEINAAADRASRAGAGDSATTKASPAKKPAARARTKKTSPGKAAPTASATPTRTAAAGGAAARSSPRRRTTRKPSPPTAH